MHRDRSSLNRNVRLVVAIKALGVGFALPLPTLVLLFQEHGLSIQEIMLLQAMFAVIITVCEVPSGYLADVLSRRGALLAGHALLLIGSLIYLNGADFWAFLAAEVAVGIAFSLVSGADQALLYDSLAERDEQERFAQIWGNATAVSMVAAAVGCILGGFVASYGLHLPFIGTAVMFGSAALLAAALYEPKRSRVQAERGHAREICSIARSCLWEREEIRWLIGFAAFVGTSLTIALWYYQPYFRLAGLPLVWNGVVFALFNLVAALTARKAHLLQRRFGVERLSLMIVVLLTISFLMPAMLVAVGSIGLFLLHQMVRSVIAVVFADEVNQRVDGSIRATVASLQSMATRLWAAVILVPFGWLADHYGLPSGLVVLALLLVGGGVAFVALRPRSLSEKELLAVKRG